MSKLAVVVCVLMVVGALAQLPVPCVTPPQLTLRAFEVNHRDDSARRYFVAYDETNKRKVLFEEEREIIPGRQYHEFLVLNNENVAYDINLKTKQCVKSLPHPWRSFGIPPNSTFENEYYVGGPGEEVFANEWSDRIPFRQRETWIGSFSKINCYPIHSLIIGPEWSPNDTLSVRYYDIVAGIPNPDDFIPPPECQNATWGSFPFPGLW